MNWSSMVPISTTGHSARPATSSSRPSSAISSRPSTKACCFAPRRMISLRSLGIEDHMRVAQLLFVILEMAHFDGLAVRKEAMAAAWCCRFSRPRIRTAPPRRRTCRRCRAAAAPSAPALARDSASISATAIWRIVRAELPPAHPPSRGPCARSPRHRIRPCRRSRFSHCSSVTPAERRNPSMRLFGRVDARAFLFFAHVGLLGGQPAIASVNRRGPANAFTPSNINPRSDSAPTTSRSRSFAACTCMRAGISSENSSRRDQACRPRIGFTPPIRFRAGCRLRSARCWPLACACHRLRSRLCASARTRRDIGRAFRHAEITPRASSRLKQWLALMHWS